MAAYVAIFESKETANTLAEELRDKKLEVAVFGPSDDTTTPEAQDFLSGAKTRSLAALKAGDAVMVARGAFGLGRYIEEGLEKSKPKHVFIKPSENLRHASDIIGLPLLRRMNPVMWLPKGTFSGILPLLSRGHIDPVFPMLKKGQMDPAIPHLAKGQIDPMLPHVVRGHIDPLFPLVTKVKRHFSTLIPLLWRTPR
ncbi:MAG: hypothetical protein AAGD10_07775 [Myxococcota bacterium]